VVLMICVAGMPGSGKGIVAMAARDIGIPVVTMGDVVREEATRRGLAHTPRNLNIIAEKLREEEGPAAVALRIAGKMRRIKEEAIIVDGVRSLAEMKVFRGMGRTVIIAVHASPRTRFKRLLERGRPGDPRSWEEFEERDMVELGFGLGNVIALADYMIVNEGGVEEAYREARRILSRLMENGEDKG